MASLKTMKAKSRAKIKVVEPYPYTIPMELAKAATEDEWLEGIPPFVNKSLNKTLCQLCNEHGDKCGPEDWIYEDIVFHIL